MTCQPCLQISSNVRLLEQCGPRHEIVISKNVTHEVRNKNMTELKHEPGKEVIASSSSREIVTS